MIKPCFFLTETPSNHLIRLKSRFTILAIKEFMGRTNLSIEMRPTWLISGSLWKCWKMGIGTYFWRSNDWWLSSGSNWIASSQKTGLAKSGLGMVFLSCSLENCFIHHKRTPKNKYRNNPTVKLHGINRAWSHNPHATKRLVSCNSGFPSSRVKRLERYFQVEMGLTGVPWIVTSYPFFVTASIVPKLCSNLTGESDFAGYQLRISENCGKPHDS